jgi:hypothetical protein
MREKTNITLHPTVKRSATLAAQRDGRSLSEMIERLLEDHLRTENPPAARAKTKGTPKKTSSG